jgi:hypothetical protein
MVYGKECWYLLQTIGFWLQYIISLRSALYKKGFVPRKDWRAIFGEEAFINMIELMTELDVQERSVHQHMHRWRGNIKMVISEGDEYDSERLRWGPMVSFL